jgi:hypothetical protein
MIYQCCNEKRKSAVLGNKSLNGIDYLEVLDSGAPNGVPRQQVLLVHCLNLLASLSSPPGAQNVLITGGESITDITVVAAVEATSITDTSTPPPIAALLPVVTALLDIGNVLVVLTNQPGDFSPYQLRLVNDAQQASEDVFEITSVLTGFDGQLAEVEFSFKVECGPDFDCDVTPACPVPAVAPPPINYLAKDYGSFRSIMLDRMNQLVPSWNTSSEADLGIALAELIAYVGDRLSYQQDAIATEAYIATARRRVSLRRHARLVDYFVHDGCNARAWVQVQVSGNTGAPVFLDRTQTRFYTTAPGMPESLMVGSNNEQAAVFSGVQVFEPMHNAVLYPELDQFDFYTWGDTTCCLPQGATEATLLNAYPRLRPGDVLVFQEVLGPQTGDPADADLRHRCAVRLTAVSVQDDQGQPLKDPLFTDDSGNPILVTEIQWAAADALPFPPCLSSTFLDSAGDTQQVEGVSIALGNIVLADHGLTFPARQLLQVPQPRLYYAPTAATNWCQSPTPPPVPVRYRPAVPDSPVTQAVPVAIVPLQAAGVPTTSGSVLALGGPGVVAINDTNGFAALTLQASDPADWPQHFAVKVVANTTNPQEIDLTVVYMQPAGTGNPPAQVPVESFTGLSLTKGDPNFVETQINAASKLIEVPATYAAPVPLPAGFPSAPVVLNAEAPVVLLDDGSPAKPYLTLQTTDTRQWPRLFGVQAQPNATSPTALFDLSVVYDPPSGPVGITIPVTVEQFTALSQIDVDVEVAASALINIASLVQTPDLALSAADLMGFDANEALPAVTLVGTLDSTTTTWTVEADLLESGEADPVFVVETESDGSARFRFGDNTNGLSPISGTSFTTGFRIGNGTPGNVGAESLTNFASPNTSIVSCINPLPATGGTDPETADQIRRRAPQAFLTQERAVTMADYQTLAEQNTQVDQAVATLRWTGSWYTAFVAAEPQGGGTLTPTLSKSLKQGLEQYRLAGQDLEIDSPDYVSLEIGLTICVDPAYFRADVEAALQQVLGSGILPNGQKGVFYPDNFTFGQTVYLSPIYAAARSVAGVLTVTATTFQQQGMNTTQYLAAGEMKLGPLQVARLDNDPSYPANGKLNLYMEGGK